MDADGNCLAAVHAGEPAYNGLRLGAARNPISITVVAGSGRMVEALAGPGGPTTWAAAVLSGFSARATLSRMIEAGYDDYAVIAISGHSSTRMLAR